ncbi:MAG: hypothetical protein IPG47_02530 [Thermoflexaceae bacterium]|nr:hypothetical protein [Thermoflexaceae bacterium]
MNALREELWKRLEAEVYRRLRGDEVEDGKRIASAEGYLRAARDLAREQREELLHESNDVEKKYTAALASLDDPSLARKGANTVRQACEGAARAARVRATHDELSRVLGFVGARAKELGDAFERANSYVLSLVSADASGAVQSVVSNDARHIFVVPPLNSPELSMPEPAELDAGLTDGNTTPWSQLLVDYYRSPANFETEFVAFREALEAHGRKRCAGKLDHVSLWDALRLKSGEGEWPAQAMQAVFDRLKGVSGAAWTPNKQRIFAHGAAEYPSAMAVTDTAKLSHGLREWRTPRTGSRG